MVLFPARLPAAATIADSATTTDGRPLTAQLSHDVIESLLDIQTVLGRSFEKAAAQLSGQRSAFLRRDLALRHAITFVADQHDGWRTEVSAIAWKGRRAGRFLDSADLVVEALELLEGCAG